MADSKKIISGRWKGIVRKDWQEVFTEIDPLASAGEVVIDKPERVVRRIKTARGVVYYKWICGPGRSWYFLKSLFRQPRSLAVWQVSEEMRLAGLECPLPLLAVSSCSFSAFRCEDILVTAEVPFPRISDLLQTARDNTSRMFVLGQAGQYIRELHEKGFVHGDCLPGNLCMDESGRLIFLDNDRTVRKSGVFARAGRLRNLIQFCSHALTVLPDQKLLNGFLDSYDRWKGNTKVKNITDTNAVIKKLQQRVTKLEKEFGKKFPGCKLDISKNPRQ